MAFFNDIFWLNLHKKKFYLKFGAKKCENDAGQPPFSPICFVHRERDFEAGFREFWRLEHRLLKDEFQNQEPEKKVKYVKIFLLYFEKGMLHGWFSANSFRRLISEELVQ